MAMDKQWKKSLDDGTEVTRTCAWSPPGCHPVGCGLRLFVKDGKLTKVEGDPEHPITKGKLCVRCLALKEYIEHPDRVIYPQKRVGARGENKWERISWPDALQMIKEKRAEIVEKYGPESIVVFSGTGREASNYGYGMAFGSLGTPNNAYTQSGWSCYGPRIAVTSFILGAGYPEIDWAGAYPDRYDNPAFKVPEYILLWGKEPLKSNPDGFFGHAIIELIRLGTKLICVDPRTTWLGTRSEHILYLRPGTDTALAMALLNVIIEEDLYDKDFVDKWTFGFEQFADRIKTMSPEQAEEITWVPATQIREIARLLATAKPTSMMWGLAIDQNPNGVQLGHCLLALTAITGNLDVPGGTIVGRPFDGLMSQEFSTIDDVLMDKKVGKDDYPAIDMTLNTCHPDILLDQLEGDEPYPIRMGFFMSSQQITATNSAQPNRWHKALKKLDFAVVTDVFHTPTSQAFADLFLPLASFAEHNGMVLTHYGMNMAFMGAINKALQVGECKSDIEIMLEIAKVIHPDWEGLAQTPEEHLSNQLAGMDMDFDKFREIGCYQPGQDYLKHEKGMLRPDGEPGFNTKSGRIELYSYAFEALGDDPLPYYEEPRWSQFSKPEFAEEFPLVMTTGARDWATFHSEHRQIATLREITPQPWAEINPELAAEHGIKDGDWCYVENMFGKAKHVAKVTPIINKNVVSTSHGWWFPEEDPTEPNLYGVWKSNVNDMIPHKEIGKMGFGAPYKSMMCKLYKAQD